MVHERSDGPRGLMPIIRSDGPGELMPEGNERVPPGPSG